MLSSWGSSQVSTTRPWVAVASRPLGLAGATPSWAATEEKSRTIAMAKATIAANRMGNHRLSALVNMVPACAGVWDAARPVRRRQPIEERRAPA